MKLDAYSTSDINMYLSSTYMMYDNKPIKIRSFEDLSSDNVNLCYKYLDNNGHKDHSNKCIARRDDFSLDPIPMGYYPLDNFVVYLYKYQRSHFKKLICNDTIRSFIPQDRELRVLHTNVNLNYEDVILKGQKFFTLDEAFEKMQKKNIFSIALHPHYALVKKGYKKDLVIYYKTDPVITYDGETLTPLVDECHVTKFKLELEL